MSAWIEDAQIITEIKDLARNSTTILQKTADVDDFLSNADLTSAALVAPKGFGKTLIMKLKRVALQDDGYRCLPEGMILDRPRDRPPILAADILNFLEASENWETAWQIAFSLAVIKANRDDANVVRLTKSLFVNDTVAQNLLENPTIETPFEALHAILLRSRSEIFEIFRHSAGFTSIYQRIHKKTAIFVDNIDEYLEHYINYEYGRKTATHAQYLKLWHNGQIGAWHALRRLNGINPHIRIFISMRKEAYHYASEKEAQFANLRSFAKDLRYTREDIVKIIENNIVSEPSSKLVDKNAKDPFRQFVGASAEIISNSGTGKLEQLKDYWIRHCTLRPRDAISIGKAISALKPGVRDGKNVRNAINTAAAERAQSLFAEVMPFFDGLFPDIFHRIIRTNVLSNDEVSDMASKYTSTVSEQFGVSSESISHPFCALYAIGLVGVVAEDRDRRGRLIQTFSPVGKVPFGKVNILPRADRYLLHPSFTDYIQSRNVGFIKTTNRQNVIGDTLEWRSEQEIRFVIIGDMRGYRERIMNKPGSSQTFAAFWADTFRAFTGDLDFADWSQGDRVVLADRSPTRLIEKAKSLMIALRESQYQLSFRMGGHSGFWRLNNDADGSTQPEISEVLGVAARIEPHARPGDIVVSELFLHHAEGLGLDVSKLNFERADASYGFSADRFFPDKGLLISKLNKEAEEFVQPFFIAVDGG